MKQMMTCLLAFLGLTAYGQKSCDTYEVDVFKTKNGKEVRFHALVHASIRIEYDGQEIEIDPVTKLGNRTIDYTAMPKADYLLVTHEHGDHFDKEAIKLLTGDKTQLVMHQAGVRTCLQHDGRPPAVPSQRTRQWLHPDARRPAHLHRRRHRGHP